LTFRDIIAGDVVPERVDPVIKACLVSKFGENNVKPEWDVAKESRDALNRVDYEIPPYCPRIDFAIGPFNIDKRLRHNNKIISQRFLEFEEFFNELKRKNQNEWSPLVTNRNPRCFVAVEVENRNTDKHMMGSIINASAIGKIGILISSDETNYEAMNRIRVYMDFLKRAKKMESYPQNIIVVKRSDFIDLFRI